VIRYRALLVFAAAAALGRNLPANHRAFSKFLADLEPMLSQFICAHPLCPKNPSLEAIHCDPEQFMFKAAPSNNKPRWAASYDPTKKATYCSWFLELANQIADAGNLSQSPGRPARAEFI
jgi:hypothetical protein